MFRTWSLLNQLRIRNPKTDQEKRRRKILRSHTVLSLG